MKNKDKITQCRFYFDLEKELKYINEMNKQGYKLVYIKSGCLYTFIKTQPDEYTTIFYAVEKEKFLKSLPLLHSMVMSLFLTLWTVLEIYCT